MPTYERFSLFNENNLVGIATMHEDDDIAKRAARILINRYDKTYHYCNECDGQFTTEKDCCLNKPEENNIDDILKKL